MLHTVKLINLKPWEVSVLKGMLHYYTNHGIKITYLRKVIYIHCDTAKPYQCLLNTIWNYRDRLVCNQKTMDWLSGYYPFELLK